MSFLIFPNEKPDFSSTSEWKLKSYPTHYLNLEQRKRLGIEITIKYYDEKKFGENKFLLQHKITNITKTDNSIYIATCLNLITNEVTYIKTKHVVFGGGRFMPIDLADKNFTTLINTTFKRVELGVRFEGSSTNGIYNLTPNVDPKFMKWDNQNKIEFRSFCTCRNGETCVTNSNGIRTWSGRSDCAPTGLSNFGFNLVFKDEKYLNLLDIARKTKPFEIKMRDIYNLEDIDISAKVGEYKEVLEYIKDGLESFIDHSGIQKDNFMNFYLKGPTIEGVGNYPVLDENLKVPDENIWVIGDSTGIFRGIIASMLSGIFVGDILKELI